MGADAGTEATKAFNAKKLALADRIRKDARLTGSTRLIGAEICSLTNFRTGYAWCSQEYLAEQLGLVLRTVKSAVAALKAAGYIEVQKVGRENRYAPIFADEKVQNLPLSETEQVQNLPQSDDDRGKKGDEQGQKTPANRGKKVPPISLETSLGISARAAGEAAGAPPDGATGPSFDLGLPGDALLKRFGEEIFQSWLGKLAVVSIERDELVLQAPTRFVAGWVENNFTEAILDAWRVQSPGLSRLRVIQAPTPIAPKRGENPDARWLVDVGIPLVAARLHVTRRKADETLRVWIDRCGRDVTGLRRIIEETASLSNIDSEDQFRAVVKERTRRLLSEGQTAMEFLRRPQPVKRSAS
ncbi:DnaA N-terminal domain-containing protein [Bradyrhizobium liaoningense]|uniref:DnaA N-terminal domain-containing protein n=1 Tax=Bradyrhizobium liaoningense TaxID=43992 RepID=UPI001BA5C929|nr:DnaA N-terminal domain-containing protein [Bradyrhizobium liaoningense]MBR0855456.1 helix-turn-helix domain-containing protein [Bradyrhizobium liaoningense]